MVRSWPDQIYPLLICPTMWKTGGWDAATGIVLSSLPPFKMPLSKHCLVYLSLSCSSLEESLLCHFRGAAVEVAVGAAAAS
jgi:hypothetical protein